MRFSIRDLIWLTVVVAIGCCWFIHQRRLKQIIESKSAIVVNLDEETHDLRPGYMLRVKHPKAGEYSVAIDKIVPKPSATDNRP